MRNMSMPRPRPDQGFAGGIVFPAHQDRPSRQVERPPPRRDNESGYDPRSQRPHSASKAPIRRRSTRRATGDFRGCPGFGRGGSESTLWAKMSWFKGYNFSWGLYLQGASMFAVFPWTGWLFQYPLAKIRIKTS